MVCYIGKGGIGVIAQDYRGQVLCSGHSMAQGDSAKIIEARAVVEGFRLAVEKIGKTWWLKRMRQQS